MVTTKTNEKNPQTRWSQFLVQLWVIFYSSHSQVRTQLWNVINSQQHIEKCHAHRHLCISIWLMKVLNSWKLHTAHFSNNCQRSTRHIERCCYWLLHRINNFQLGNVSIKNSKMALLLLLLLLLLCSSLTHSLTHHFVHDTTGLLIKLDVLKHKTEMDKWVWTKNRHWISNCESWEGMAAAATPTTTMTTMTEASTQRLLPLLLLLLLLLTIWE